MFQQLPIKLEIDELKGFEVSNILDKSVGSNLWIMDIKEQLIGAMGKALLTLGVEEIKLLDLHPGDTRILIRLSSNAIAGEISTTISFTPKGLYHVKE